MRHENLSPSIDYRPRTDIDLLPKGLPLAGLSEEEREAIHAIYMEAIQLYKGEVSNDEVDAEVNRLGDIPGIEIIEPRSFRDGFYQRCAEYVFGEIYQEDWAGRFITNNEPLFWESPVSFLMKRGYAPTEQPGRGDVVAYGGIYEDESVWFGHFGIYDDGGKVISKYGAGPIARHDLPLISKGDDRYKGHWGDHVWFFRKETEMSISS